jgi:hypothetical protein
MAQNPNAMDVSNDGYETDSTADTILVGDGDDGYTSDEIRQINEYYDQLNDDQMTLTPPHINRGASANDNTHRTPPTRLLTNHTQMSRQVYKMVIQPDGIWMLVPFTSDDYRTGQQPFDINGHAINREELPYVQPRRLFEEKEEKEGGASKSRRRIRRTKRRRTKKSLRKRRTNKRRKTRSKK